MPSLLLSPTLKCQSCLYTAKEQKECSFLALKTKYNNIPMSTILYIHTHIQIYIDIRIYTNMHISMCVYVYSIHVYMCVCVYSSF